MFSYGGDPSTGGTDEVRFLLHDTDAANPLLQDEEIQYVLDRQQDAYGDPLMAAAICADLIAGRYAGEVSINADGVTYSGDQLQTKYQGLAAALRATFKQLASAGGGPTFGQTRRPSSFARGMHDNLWGGNQDWDRVGEIPEYPYDWYGAAPGGLNDRIGS